MYNLPKTDACLERNRIWIPIRAYNTIITTIGMAKNISDESSHNGNPGGLSSIAQNADSSIVVLSAKQKVKWVNTIGKLGCGIKYNQKDGFLVHITD